MKKIAIITGASSGMGLEFAKTAAAHVPFDEMWVIARRAERLQALAEQLKGQTTVVPVPMDLEDRQKIVELGERIAAEKAEVVLLINASGFGKFQAVMDVDMTTANRMVDLNCTALMDMCYVCIPHMKRGARILNIASVAGFQPVPYIAEYAATKAFVLNFSRALWKELQPKGITVTALCPYWTKTEFFDTAQTRSGKDVIRYFNAMYYPQEIVQRGWRDLLKGRDLSTYGFIARAQIMLVRLLPHRIVMWVWNHQQGIK